MTMERPVKEETTAQSVVKEATAHLARWEALTKSEAHSRALRGAVQGGAEEMEDQGEVREDWRTKVMPLDYSEAKVSEDRGGAEAEPEGVKTMAKLDGWRIPVEPKEGPDTATGPEV